jgi:hypothetical protein
LKKFLKKFVTMIVKVRHSLIICPCFSGLKQKRMFLNKLFGKLFAVCKTYHVRNHYRKFASGSSQKGVNSLSKQSSTFLIALINASAFTNRLAHKHTTVLLGQTNDTLIGYLYFTAWLRCKATTQRQTSSRINIDHTSSLLPRSHGFASRNLVARRGNSHTSAIRRWTSDTKLQMNDKKEELDPTPLLATRPVWSQIVPETKKHVPEARRNINF